ncbi:carboxylate-amine ligase [Amaricoccus solimangrovi]|uniref:Putative glutamate--cysteine ligase 2 n=1 Tax=Amaricoccus solimangrovi TaxID=2589815 RepID=A0A501WZQ0_9RHOB|nr:carboxylate-amine ligase [Amaricoccus solimangrovi]TPE51636.1 carboxylate-amine ligase [Amaricoccus solimangrovi]
MDRPSLSLGIEEEYLIVDRAERDLVAEPDGAFFEECRAALGEQVSAEFLRCQIEVGTRPCETVAQAVAELRALRATIAECARNHGYAAIAASTHPFARWRDQHHTPKRRYDEIWSDIGAPASRMMICGMHMHVGVEDPDLRIDLMNQITYFLPHLLALSTSSPFWQGQDTRLACYRLTVMDALPRTGLPDTLASDAEYRALVAHLVETGCIEDGTRIWWDIRPSARFPTLEQRVTDVCPRLEDVAALAALFQGLVAFLFRLRRANQRWRIYPPTLILENRWRAQRHGAEARLIDHGRRRPADLEALVEELIELVGPDTEDLGCREELSGLRRIAMEGTSATRQRQVYAGRREAGSDHEAALRAVVDALIEEFSGA